MRRSRGILRHVRRALLGILAACFACAAYIYLTLPDVRPLRTANPGETAFMRLRADEARREGDAPRRVQRWIPYGRISGSLTRAVLAAEDSAFWAHAGIDLQQIKESFEINLERREFARGASTITQQLAKNLYLSPSKNPVRKLKELVIARRLEVELSKRRILEIYLNVIEWGDGIYGAEAAARTYFRKPAAALSADEAALLAAAIINPRVLDPGRPSARLRARQQLIMRRMGAQRPPAREAPAQDDEPSRDEVRPGGASRPVEGVPRALPGEVLPLPGDPRNSVQKPGGG